MADANIGSLELQISSNSKQATEGINALISSLTKLKNATKGLGLGTVAKDIENVGKATEKASDSNGKAIKSFTDLYFKMKSIGDGFKKAGQTIMSFVEKSSEYNEIVNLFSVSMGQYAEEAYDYAEQVSEVMGIDTAEWMKSQGVFMTLATGFGVAGDRAAKMSEQLTQLGYDISSFQDISVEEAMQKLQSGLAGELEPLRRIGYDLSQAKLEATALELGITKSVSSMTQAEKAQLRYYAIMTQVTQQQGDMARTLDEPANQMRIFKAQVNMAARSIGDMFIPALNAILPYATAVVKVVGSLASIIAGLFGHKKAVVENKDIATVVGGAEDTGTALDDATESAKKLKSYMLGFDELNIINPNTESTEDLLGDEFDFELPEYDFLGGAVESKLNTIVEEMKEWLGITDDIDTWAELFNTRLGTILITVGLIGVAFAAWKIATGVSSLITWFSKPKNLAIFKQMLGKIGGIAIAIVGAVLIIKGTLDAIINGLDWGNLATILLGIALLVGGLFIAFGAVGAAIGMVVGGLVLLVTGIADFLKNGATAQNIIAVAVGIGLIAVGLFIAFGWVGLIIAAVVAVVAAFVMFTEEIVGAIWWLGSLFKNVGLWLANLGLAIWAIIKNIGLWFANLGLAAWTILKNIGLWFANLGLSIWTIIKNIGLWFANLGISVWKIIKNTGLWFANLGLGIWEVLKAATHNVGVAFNNLWVAVQIGFWKMIDAFMQGIKSLVSKLKPILEFLGINVDLSSMDFAQKKIDSLKQSKEEFTNIGDAWEKGFNTYQYDSIEEAYNTFDYDSVKDAMGTFDYDSVKDAFSTFDYDSVSEAFDTFDTFAEGWGKDAYDAGAKVGEGLQDTMKSWVGIEEKANATSTFVAPEMGADMISFIGGKTTVTNDDQIVSGIANGVAEANGEQNALLREQNSLLQGILEKETNISLDGKTLTNSVEKYQRERGRTLITGGVV